MNLLIEVAVESTAILLAALALVAVLRRQSAALRHWILAVAFACVALAPAIGALAPSWGPSLAGLPQLVGLGFRATDTAQLKLRPTESGATSTPAPPAALPQPQPAPSVMNAVLPLWVAGALAALAVLALGMWRLTRLTLRSSEITAGIWAERIRSLGSGRAARVRLLLTHHPSLLVTWGALRPEVILPSAAQQWTQDRIDVVLLHELAHVRRGDWLVQIVAEILKCLLWFNPLVWLACARLRVESEHACDDAVLERGVEGSTYARHLVDIARELKRGRIWMPAVAIARPSSLERRVRAMLDARVNRRPLSRLAAAAAVLVLTAVTIPLAGFAAQTVFSSVKGTVLDPSNNVVPGATLVLTNTQTQAKYEVQSDKTGRYEFLGVVQGDYAFEAKLPGFMTLRGTLTLTGQSVQKDVNLQIGTLQETITVSSSRSAASVAPAPLAKPIARPPAPNCTPAATGGNIRPPLKLRDVRPVYPVSMSSQGVEGTAQLEARIGVDGTVEDVRVVSAPHQELGIAAADAVRDWIFTETLLNCAPVAVQMKVTVNFTLQK